MLKLENITLDIPVYNLAIPKTLNRYVIDHILKTKKKEKNFKRILDNITLELNPGESLGIIGKKNYILVSMYFHQEFFHSKLLVTI